MFFENNRVAGDAAAVTQLPAGPLNGGIVPVPGPGLPDWDSRKVGQTLVEKALAFIDQEKDKPFYIHLSTDGAHGPYTPPDTLLGTPVKGESKMTPKTDMAYEVDVVVGKFEPDQMLDSVSLAPVLLGQRDDDQPVRRTLLIQSSPGRDALAERDPELPRPAKGAPKRTSQERQAAMNKAWNQIAKKGANSGSDGMAHALREGPWKLVFNIEHDKPAALYNLADDLTEQQNLIADAAQTDRIQRMEKLYREIRASQRSVPVVGEN